MMKAPAFVLLFALALALPQGARSADAGPLKLVAFGDSLVHGYGLAEADSFPAQLERALEAEGRAVEVINAGNSGDTTAGGLARLDWALADGPDAVIVELGANDGLRGIDPERDLCGIWMPYLEPPRGRAGVAGAARRNAGATQFGKRLRRAAFDGVYPAPRRGSRCSLLPLFPRRCGDCSRSSTKPMGSTLTRAGVAVLVERILPSVHET